MSVSSTMSTPSSPLVPTSREVADDNASLLTVPTARSARSSASRRVTSSGTLKTNSASSQSKSSSRHLPPQPRIITTPKLPHDPDAQPVGSTCLYWSKAPVHGKLPLRTMRGHTVTLVDTIVWLFGGGDETSRSSSTTPSTSSLYCFDVETLEWSHPTTTGVTPPPSRAHTTILYDRKLIIYGGGQNASYYSTVHIFDTTLRRWSVPKVVSAMPSGEMPHPRRAHSAVLYKDKVWVFGGGNGMMPLNDLWTLDVSELKSRKGAMHHRGSFADYEEEEEVVTWTKVKTYGLSKPLPRGYHTANLIGRVMIVIGGSDGGHCFPEIWALDLDSLEWREIIKLDPSVSVSSIAANMRPSPLQSTSSLSISSRSESPLRHTTSSSGSMTPTTEESPSSLLRNGKKKSQSTLRSQVTPSPPFNMTNKFNAKRLSHTATQVGSFLFVQGGHNGEEYTDTMWFFNLVGLHMEEKIVLGRPPSARGYHATIVFDSRMFFFGGYDGSQAYDEVYILDLATSAYLPQVTSFEVDLHGPLVNKSPTDSNSDDQSDEYGSGSRESDDD